MCDVGIMCPLWETDCTFHGVQTQSVGYPVPLQKAQSIRRAGGHLDRTRGSWADEVEYIRHVDSSLIYILFDVAVVVGPRTPATLINPTVPGYATGLV